MKSLFRKIALLRRLDPVDCASLSSCLSIDFIFATETAAGNRSFLLHTIIINRVCS